MVYLFKIHYTVYNKNLENMRGHDGAWYVIGIPSEESFDNGSFMIGNMVIELIANTDQEGHIKIIHRETVVTGTTTDDSDN